MSFSELGCEFCPGLIDQEAILKIRAEMLAIMGQFCEISGDNPNALDDAFNKITHQSKELRGNVLKMFSRIASLPLLLSEKKLAAKIKQLGVLVPVIQAYSIVCMEPNEKRFLFQWETGFLLVQRYRI